MHGLSRQDHPTGHRVAAGPVRMLAFERDMVRPARGGGDQAIQLLLLLEVDVAGFRAAQPARRLGDDVEDDLQVERRAADDLEDLVRCRLSIEGLVLEVAQPLVARDAAIRARRIDGSYGRARVVGGAHLDAADDAAEVVDVGDDDDRQGRQGRIGLDRREGLVAVELGHHQVEQDDVDRRRPGIAQAGQCETSVLGLDGLVTERGQEASEHQPVDPAVVDHQDPGGSGDFAAPRWRSRAARRRHPAHRRRSASRRADPGELGFGRVQSGLGAVERSGAGLSRSSSRAIPASVWAPSVALLDLRVWAGRTRSSAEPAATAARAASQLIRSVGQVGRGELVEERGIGADRLEQLGDGRLIEGPDRLMRARRPSGRRHPTDPGARSPPGSGPPRARPFGWAC